MNTQTEAVATTNHVNGVDVMALSDTIQAVRQDPGLAEFRFRASNRWIDCGHNRSTVQAFHGCRQEDGSRDGPFVLDADEPAVLLGKDNGANPVEYVLHALAACLTTSIVYHAAARGIAIRGVESRLEGELDLQGFLGLSDTVRPGYRKVRVDMRVASDAPADTLRELARFSPVYDIVSKSVPVELTVSCE
ncbi:OsmC family protein [Methylonatrum kenyense]|uniref:OsmC family protein n=1 Tax=Methylonatrum kenyense TaxID=455253 RepID=UPI0020BD883F|nr:OsmC family protein [Methylonatrum kenyense]MCK8515015.1 OsmC family protein [Methylonatrum kenyense]